MGELGELVITQPMPSMPVAFWNDPDGSRYRAAYFEHFPGVWRHGDWIVFTERGSSVITGRSDATLNRGGVRLGTSELYSVVEEIEEVLDSLVVHLEDSDELLLFVVLRPGVELDDELRARIAGVIRAALSPRHAPDAIVAVPAIPRTLTGKKLELPVKRILTGIDVREVVSRDALVDPDAIEPFADYAKTRSSDLATVASRRRSVSLVRRSPRQARAAPSRGSGRTPSRRSSRSAACVLARVIRGMIEASTTRSPSVPKTRNSGSTTDPIAQVEVGW